MSSGMCMDVDTALAEVPVNIMPLTDDTDFKTRETAVAFNAAGMDLVWNFVTTAGVMTQTAVTPTSGGDYDWTNQGDGMYSIEIPASGGASINNDQEGFGYFSGVATGILPWRGPTICFRAAALNNALVDGGDNLDVDVQAIAANAVNAAALATDAVNEIRDAITGGAYSLDTDSNGRMRVVDGTGAGEISLTAGAIDQVGNVQIVGPGAISSLSFQVGAITAGAIAASALDNKGNWNIGKTGYALSSSGMDSVTLPANIITATAIAAGALNGKGDWPTAVAIRTEIDANSTQLAAIVADTNELQQDWANGGRLDLILDGRAAEATLTTVDGKIDTIDLNVDGLGVLLSTVDANLVLVLGDTSELQTRFDAMLENVGGWRFTTAALAQAPGGGSSITVNEIWQKLRSSETWPVGSFGYFLDALISSIGGAVGPGAIQVEIEIQAGGTPVAGVAVWISTDAGGAATVAGPIITDAFGKANFLLDAGTYYRWAQKPGYDFVNPQEFTVTS